MPQTVHVYPNNDLIEHDTDGSDCPCGPNIWRADLKNDAVEDLKKAAWYLAREIERQEALNDH